MMPGDIPLAFAAVVCAVMSATAGAALADKGSRRLALAPGASVCHPAAHGSQPVAPVAAALVPFAHAVHVLAPCTAAYVPGAQATHVCTPLPSTSERYPASHKQTVAACSVSGVSGLLLCAGHALHVPPGARQYVSALQ